MQDLYTTNSTQETCPIDYADYTAPTQKHDQHHTRSGIYLPCLADLDHEVGLIIWGPLSVPHVKNRDDGYRTLFDRTGAWTASTKYISIPRTAFALSPWSTY